MEWILNSYKQGERNLIERQARRDRVEDVVWWAKFYSRDPSRQSPEERYEAHARFTRR